AETVADKTNVPLENQLRFENRVADFRTTLVNAIFRSFSSCYNLSKDPPFKVRVVSIMYSIIRFLKIQVIEKWMDRDFFMTAEEAAAAGIVDRVLKEAPLSWEVHAAEYFAPSYWSSEMTTATGGSLGTGPGTYGSGCATVCGESREFGFLSKLSTLSRARRRKQEADELAEEARQAIEDRFRQDYFEPNLDGFQLAEGEERSMIEPHSKEHPLVQEAVQTLVSWINAELVDERILVRNLEADLYDGQVLQKLIEKLLSVKINHPEVSQTEIGQRQRLKLVLDEINSALNVSPMWAAKYWPVSAIFDQDMVAILRVLVALVRRFAPMVRLPRDVHLTVLIVRKINGILQHRRQVEVITESEDEQDTAGDHDAISALVDCAVPERLAAFQQTLLDFVNHHLAKINLSVSSLETEMNDGVYFILLIGLLGGFFVPLHAYHLTPLTNAQRQANLQLAFKLAEEVDGINLGPKQADDLLRHDLKVTLRLLYSLYDAHKNDL
ncbi:alpha-parvin, partial [Clonorchis sinensis]